MALVVITVKILSIPARGKEYLRSRERARFSRKMLCFRRRAVLSDTHVGYCSLGRFRVIICPILLLVLVLCHVQRVSPEKRVSRDHAQASRWRQWNMMLCVARLCIFGIVARSVHIIEGLISLVHAVNQLILHTYNTRRLHDLKRPIPHLMI